jgi:hypothetical protein
MMTPRIFAHNPRNCWMMIHKGETGHHKVQPCVTGRMCDKCLVGGYLYCTFTPLMLGDNIPSTIQTYRYISVCVYIRDLESDHSQSGLSPGGGRAGFEHLIVAYQPPEPSVYPITTRPRSRRAKLHRSVG